MSFTEVFSLVKEMIERGWEGFLGRPGDSLGLRFYIQPAVAILLAIRDGMSDFRRGSSPFIRSVLNNPWGRRELLKNAWLHIRKIFFVSIVLDVIYQWIEHKFVIYPMELVFTAACLALVPYLVVRGPAYRIIKLIMEQKVHRKE